jgi:hypothetical protein
MKVNISLGRIEKFIGRPGTISLEFKTTFSTVVYELELKYGVNYTEDFGHHLDHQSNLCHSHHHRFSSCIIIAIAHHGTMPNNPNFVLTSVNLSPQ